MPKNMISPTAMDNIDKTFEHGPFDIIGDVHGCWDELLLLLKELGYSSAAEKKKELRNAQAPADGLLHAKPESADDGAPREKSQFSEGAAHRTDITAAKKKLRFLNNADLFTFTHPENRKLVFVGDLCDRGPKNLETLIFALTMSVNTKTFFVLGNHDYRFLRKLKGNQVQITHGLENTLDELNSITFQEHVTSARDFTGPANKKEGGKAGTACVTSDNISQRLHDFLSELPPYYIFDDRKLLVSHAGIDEHDFGKTNNSTIRFCLFGDVTGELDSNGFPIRRNWQNNYSGQSTLVYGHTPHINPLIINNTYNIDTGCVFGNKLTCLRYPEMTLVQVNSLKRYSDRMVPLD